MMAHAIGREVGGLSLSDQPVTQEAIIEKLEHYRREKGNVIGKGFNRDAADFVKKSNKTRY
ncbi:hypothetical protein [Enterobacter sp. HK-058-C-ECC]|uniref:hypothetical protein n=1 Tax=Enterobacter sp. HK-058-C-ECC TaxID=3397227 RepID=UPI0039E0AFCF